MISVGERCNGSTRDSSGDLGCNPSVPVQVQVLPVANQQFNQQADGVADTNSQAAELLSELERTKAELQEKTLYLQTLFETVPVGIFVVDAETRLVLDSNPHAQKLIGAKKDQIVGYRCNNVVCPAGDRACPILDFGQTIDQSERVVLTKDGRRLPVLKSVVQLVNDGHRVLVESFVDITEIKKAQTEILNANADLSTAQESLIAAKEAAELAALHDPLTKLPNRRLLSERLRQVMVTSTRSNLKSALLFIDLDDFKRVNDTLGHDAGDILLQTTGCRLSICVRDVDTVARLGGDEFVVILEGLSESQEKAANRAKIVAEKILAIVSQSCRLNGRECICTASIGIVVFGGQRDSIDNVLQRADIAMYHAKAKGRNGIHFFAPALQEAIMARAALEEDLRQAIGTKQFVLHYQPQIEAGNVVGVEALIRWNHATRGTLAPAEFISMAEETGLIVPLGTWVLETACKQIAAWAQSDRTSDMTVAVNISARQLRQPDFVQQVLDAVNRAGANPRNLKLELTESMLLENIEEVIGKMADLKVHGLSFSLDDFGTGYSSLAYLKRLPLDQLKIDRAFVRDMLTDVTSSTIAQTAICLGNAMGLSVMAEGVETSEERSLLASLGCHSYQGYLFSPALPLEEFEQWLRGFALGNS